MLFKFLPERAAQISVAGCVSQIRKRVQCNGAKSRLIQLGFHRQQRTTFHPPVTDSEILRKALSVIRRFQKLIRLPQTVPLSFGEIDIAALRDVIVHRDDVKRSRIRRRVAVLKLLEPIDETRRLRNLVRDFSVVTLEFADEIDCSSRVGEIADGIQRERSPHRVAAKKPCVSWPRALTRCSVTRDQSGSEIWIRDHALQHADARPVVRLLQLLVRKGNAHRVAQIVCVIFRGLLTQLVVILEKMTISFFRFGVPVHRPGNHDELLVFAFVCDAEPDRVCL